MGRRHRKPGKHREEQQSSPVDDDQSDGEWETQHRGRSRRTPQVTALLEPDERRRPTRSRPTPGTSSGHPSPRQQYPAEDSDDDVTEPMQQLQVRTRSPVTATADSPPCGDVVPLPRTRYGTRGRKIALIANYLKLEVKLRSIYQYDVTIERVEDRYDFEDPTDPGKMVKRLVMQQLRQQTPDLFARNPPAYDGMATLYTARRLPIPNDHSDYGVTLDNRGTEERFAVTLKLVAELDIAGMDVHNPPQEIINAVDIVFTQEWMNRSWVAQIGRNLLNADAISDEGAMHRLWRGRHQSVRPCEWAPLTLNVDVTHYVEQNLIDFVCNKILSLNRRDMNRPISEDNRRKLDDELTGLKVTCDYSGRRMKRRVSGVTQRPAKTQTFMLNGNRITVKDYFYHHYNIELTYPDFPCVCFGERCYIPMELCRLAARSRERADPQTRMLVQKMAMPPHERKAAIEKQISKANYSSDEYLRSFGITVGDRMMSLDGRVLDPPPILYNSGRSQSQPFKGSWNGQGRKLYSVFSDNNQWALVSFDRQFQNLENFKTRLMQIARELGMSWAEPAEVLYGEDDRRCNELFRRLMRRGIKMVVCVIYNQHSYPAIKQNGDVRCGIMTQCVTSQTARQAKPQNTANVCLKINAKLGGVNFVPDDLSVRSVMSKPTIVIGADVTHPDSRDTCRPSIAAVVGSHDDDAVRYSAAVRVQQRRLETIAALEEMVKELLLNFYRKIGSKPHKIIYYRDGVGESQFSQLLQTELLAIRSACTKLELEYKPAITFLIVQKNHRTRFFPQNPDQDGEGRHRNIPAGTIADRTVTDPRNHNFYLSSHAAIQGTSRPGHYFVPYDDSRHTMDELQALTFYLCHVYSNCTRSVSTPAPAYYAHKAAFMAKYHLDSVFPPPGARGGPQCDDEGQPTEMMQRAVQIHDNIKDTMYFL